MASQRQWAIICCAVAMCCTGSATGGVHFSSLSNTLLVEATVRSNSSSPHGKNLCDALLSDVLFPVNSERIFGRRGVSGVAKAGADQLAVTWRLNGSLPAGTAAGYARVKVKLCFCPVSQVDRPWRKTDDDLAKDKTCQFDVAERAFSDGAVTWTVEKDVAGGSYFVRAYALDAPGREVAYGETRRRKNDQSEWVLVIEPISGRHVSLLIATLCFSIFSVLALPGFFVAEKLAAKKGITK